MKNLIFITVFVFLCGMLTAQNPVDLKYNLTKGKKYRVQSTAIANQIVKVQGTDRTTETKSYSTLSLKLLESKPEFFMAEVKFDTIRTVINMPPMEMSSANPGDIHSSDVVKVTSCILNRLSNSTLLVQMSYQGKVLNIVNYDVIKKSVLQGTDSLKGMAAMAKDQLVKTVDEDALVGMIEGVTAYLPKEKVEEGSKWESTFFNSGGGAMMKITSDYKLISLNKDNAVIEGQSEFQPASNEPMMVNGASVTNELSGVGKTNMEIDPESGWRIKSTTKVQMAGNMIVNAPGQAMTIPVTSTVESNSWSIE